MLIEPCRPGTELRCRPEAEQHVVITDLLRQLQQIRLDEGHRFRTLTSMCDEWADRAEQTIARSTGAPKVLDAGLIRDGLALFRALPRTADRETLLCTDLHAGNVLSGIRQPWLLIDPNPYVGDPSTRT